MIAKRVLLFLAPLLFSMVRCAQRYQPLVDMEEYDDEEEDGRVVVELKQSQESLTVCLVHPVITSADHERFQVEVECGGDDENVIVIEANQNDPFTVWMDMTKFAGCRRFTITPKLCDHQTGNMLAGTPLLVKWSQSGRSLKHNGVKVFTFNPCRFYPGRRNFIVEVPSYYGPVFVQFMLTEPGTDKVVRVSSILRVVGGRLKVRKERLLPRALAWCNVRVNVALPGCSVDGEHTLLQALTIPTPMNNHHHKIHYH